jgi:parallel beta-helix repeat protein
VKKRNYPSSLKVSSLLMALTLTLWIFGAIAVNAKNAPPGLDPIIEDPPPFEDSCGARIDTAAYNLELQQIQTGYPAPPAILPAYRIYYVPMTIHIVRSSAHTGGLTTAELTSAISSMNTYFAQTQVQLFQQGDVHYIDNDYYYTHDGDTTSLWNYDRVAYTINVYFCPAMTYGVGGSSTVGQPYAVIRNMYASSSVFPHEVGHALNLYHTHQGYTQECPNGSNCATAGDFVCDTPADPGLRNHAPSCVYDNFARSIAPCVVGQQYNPDTHNIMSYAPISCCNHLSTGQSARMRVFLEVLNTSHPGWIISRPQSFYVSVTGNDGNIGSAASPFLTIGRAVSIALSQDTIQVSTGTYTENVVVDGKTLVIKSISGPKYSTFVTAASGTAFTFTNSADGSVLEGFRIYGGAVGVRCVNSAVTVRRCILNAQTSTTEGAIVLTGNSPATILNNTVLSGANWGIFDSSSAAPTIKNNIVSHNTAGVRCANGSAQPLMSYNDVWDNRIPGFMGYYYGPVNLSNITDPGTGAMNLDPYVDSLDLSPKFYLVIGTPCANAGDPATIYNDPDGTRACMGAIETTVERTIDAYPGTGTIQAVISKASSGWVIRANPGTYYENLRYQGKAVKVRGINRPLLRPRDFYGDVMNIEFAEGLGAELSGFDITSSYCMNSIQISGGANLLIQDCVFHDVMGGGCTYNWDIIRAGSTAGLVEIKKCVFYGNRSYACIGVWPGSPVHIFNNTFYDNNRAFYSNSSNTVALNNIVTNSLVSGVSGSSYSVLDYNDVWNNAVNYTGSAVAGAHDISADPLFVNAATHDFHIQSGSPCIDAGDPGSGYDPDDTPIDMGAYYFPQLLMFPGPKLLVDIPQSFVLEQNIPNPFNPSTEIHFSLTKTSDVTLEVYNVLGQRVSVLINQNLPAGSHTVRWEGRDDSGKPVASGVYLYRLASGEFSDVKKMLLLK